MNFNKIVSAIFSETEGTSNLCINTNNSLNDVITLCIDSIYSVYYIYIYMYIYIYQSAQLYNNRTVVFRLKIHRQAKLRTMN